MFQIIEGTKHPKNYLGDVAPYEIILWYNGPQIWISKSPEGNKLFAVSAEVDDERQLERIVVVLPPDSALEILPLASEDRLPTPKDIVKILASHKKQVFIVDVDFSGEPQQVIETTIDKLPKTYFPQAALLDTVAALE